MPTQVGQNPTAPKRGQNDSLAVGCHAQSLSSSTTSRRTGLTETVAVPISLAQTTRSVAAKVFSGLAAFTSVTGQRSPVVLAWWVLSFIRACCGAAVRVRRDAAIEAVAGVGDERGNPAAHRSRYIVVEFRSGSFLAQD